MRIAVIGATGRTGRHLVGQGLARGLQVVALARSPETLQLSDAGLTIVGGDIRDRPALAEVLRGSDTIISALGAGATRAATDLYSSAVTNLIAVLGAAASARLIAISATPAGPRGEQPLLERRLAMPLLERAFGGTYADMRRMETILRGSELEWTVARPPRLRDRPATGAYRISPAPLDGGRAITVPDLASALLDRAVDGRYARQAVYVAN